MIATKTQHGIAIWVVAVLLATATMTILKRLGVIDAFAEASALSVGGMVGWLWFRRWMKPSESGWSHRFWDWTAWWVAAAFLIAALRVQGWI